jgi:hypothetical protein
MELETREYPDPDDYDEDAAVTLPCPACGAQVDEQSPRCPHCGNYITHDASIWSGRSIWWIALGVLGIIAVILALSIGF